MKRTILFISILIGLSAMSLNAQNITLEGGYFNPKMQGPNTGETYFDAIRLGGTYTYNWKYNLGFQTGLLLNTGYSHKIQRYSMSGDSVLYRTWDFALELPIRAVYKLKLFGDVSIFGFAGPNIQIGLVQNQQREANLSAALTQLTGITSGAADLYTAGAAANGIHRINLQLGAGGGVQWKDYSVKSGYDWGLNNLDATGRDYVTKGQWYVTLGYQIK
jgi:hypothetical protein